MFTSDKIRSRATMHSLLFWKHRISLWSATTAKNPSISSEVIDIKKPAIVHLWHLLILPLAPPHAVCPLTPPSMHQWVLPMLRRYSWWSISQLQCPWSQIPDILFFGPSSFHPTVMVILYLPRKWPLLSLSEGPEFGNPGLVGRARKVAKSMPKCTFKLRMLKS